MCGRARNANTQEKKEAMNQALVGLGVQEENSGVEGREGLPAGRGRWGPQARGVAPGLT